MKTPIDINSLTVGEARSIAELFNRSTVPATVLQSEPAPHPYEVGKNYFIRTVTYHLAGRLVAVLPQELVLDSASWVADSGRFTQALSSGSFNEVEMFPAGACVIVGRGAIADAVRIETLPSSQK